MQVIKRDGKKEPVNFNKISTRIKKMCKGLNKKHIDHNIVAIKVIEGIYDDIPTERIDELAAEIAASMSSYHPDYSILASKISASNMQKKTPQTFSDCVNQISQSDNNVLSDEFISLVNKHADKYNEMVVDDRDLSFDFFGLRTLQNAYLIKSKSGFILERPQYLYMRVAVAIHGEDFDKVKETYDLMSTKKFTHATPTLFNAGTKIQGLASCFLLSTKEDSIDGIYDTLKNVALISKAAGGIGISVHDVRADGSLISKTGGRSNGIVPMLKVYDSTARYINQGGKRKGSIAVYIEPWHSDIFAFLDLKKNSGKEELRARDLFYALWIPDLFMKQVESDGDWCLFCPNEAPGLSDVYGDEFDALYEKYKSENRQRKTIKARELWDKILESQIETGNPYMLYKDAANKKSNQKNLGTIKSSNLCVSGDTLLLTDKGYYPIELLEDEDVAVWNGEEWSNSTVRKTGENQKLINIAFSCGSEIKCTEYHKFFVKNEYHKEPIEVNASELKIGDKIEKHLNPVINNEGDPDFPFAYTHGAFCADGTYTNKNTKSKAIWLYGYKKNLLKYLDFKSVTENNNRVNVYLSDGIKDKFEVPVNYSLRSKLEWLAGYLDFDGCVARSKCGNESIQVSSIHKDFLIKIKNMLNTMGCSPKICHANNEGFREMPDGKGGLKEYHCKRTYRLIINSNDVLMLYCLGINFKRLKISGRKPQRSAAQFSKVTLISDAGIGDTYCLNEPIRHRVIFNGIMTGNCTEIIEYTDKNETAVCNLASIALPEFVKGSQFDFDQLGYITSVITRNLNKVIDINYHPVKEAENSNLKHRPIGIGVQGLADVFAKLKMPFDSKEAAALNKDIFECIYYHALLESSKIAYETQPYSSFKGSPASEGILQFDMWGAETSDNLRYDWAYLKECIKNHGLANSLLLAPMPTASTAQILGNNECFEPYTSNIYVRRVLSGEFIVVNKHLVNDLDSLGIWGDEVRRKIIANNGSVQGIDEIPQDIQDIYKTVWEIKQKVVIDMAADRGAFICQSQSMNIFMDQPTENKLTSMHFYGWKKGLKTGMYYLRTKPARSAIKFTVDPIEKKTKEDYDALVCSIENPENCIMCSG